MMDDTPLQLCPSENKAGKDPNGLRNSQVSKPHFTHCFFTPVEKKSCVLHSERSASLKMFRSVFTTNQEHMCAAKLFICKLFPEIVEARTVCTSLLFLEKKDLFSKWKHTT